MSLLRTIFFGTAELACASLDALVRSQAIEVIGVVTQPDRPKGRDLKMQPPPVKILALNRRLPVLQPGRAGHEPFLIELDQLDPHLIVVAAYGQILPRRILNLPRFGCVNVHTSLLPKYRGAAPIQWALLNDEQETGVTIMKMDAGLDTGDILAQQTTPIGTEDDSQSLHDRLAQLGASLLMTTIPDYVAGKVVPRKQPDKDTSYARKITKEDGHLDWTQPARCLWNRVRALTPWPVAHTFLSSERKRQLLKVWRAEVVDRPDVSPSEILEASKNGITVGCGRQALRLVTLQLEGGRRLSASEFFSGHPLSPGQRLG